MSFDIIISRAHMLLARKIGRVFKSNGFDITTEQWEVLICLWEKDGMTQQQICNVSGKDKPSVTRLINNMERKNLVVRIPNQSDKRINFIYLTHQGKNYKDKLVPLAQNIMQDAMDGVDEYTQQAGTNLLKHLIGNLSKS